MAEEKVGLKASMGGSASGRGRSAKTAEYKSASKKKRRKAGKAAVERGLAES